MQWFNADRSIPTILIVVGDQYLVGIFQRGNIQRRGRHLLEGGYFGNFISRFPGRWNSWFLVFAALVIIIRWCTRTIVRMSKIMMQEFTVGSVIPAFTIYSNVTSGCWEGVKYFLIPDMKNSSLDDWSGLAAMGWVNILWHPLQWNPNMYLQTLTY